MHRSGTSVVTRLVSLLGASLPSNLIGASKSNPTGHWESKDLVRLHERMLLEAGSDWDDWDYVSADWLASETAATYRMEILSFLERNFDDSNFFVIKDPRICRFAPFWIDLLREFDSDVFVVLVIRNPLEVAASLEARNDFPIQKSIPLWLRYVVDAERATRQVPRMLLTYEQLITDNSHVKQRLAEIVDLETTGENSEGEFDTYIDLEHYHHRFSADELYADSGISESVKSVYRILTMTLPDGLSQEDQRCLDKIYAEFNGICDDLRKFVPVGAFQVGSDVPQRKLKRTELELNKVRQELFRRKQELFRRKEETGRLKVELERALNKLKKIRRSWTWRLSRPARRLAKFISGLLSELKS